MTRLLSDDRLARRGAQGDRRAFDAIYRRYHQELYRFCLAMTGNGEDAQDALQNTMVKVLRALPGEKRQIKLKPWLYRIARNESVETLRRRREAAQLDPEQATSSWDISRAAEDRERLRKLFDDLEELPERQRAALLMRELAGLEFAQIGQAFESSAAVARQTLYEARLSLRQMEAGREMPCEEVMRELSDADGRRARRRELHAHLRNCGSCRAFRDEIATRRTDLAAIAPLPLAASAGLLHGVLGAQGNAIAGGATSAAGTSGGVAGSVGAGAGKAVATSALAKSAAAVAVVAAVGVSAADRSGLIDASLPVGSHSASSSPGGSHSASSSPGSRGAAAAPAGTAAAEASLRRRAAIAGARRNDRSVPGGRHEPSVRREGVGPDAAPAGSSVRDSNSSASDSGQSPPGGGHGRSAANEHGRPERPPGAATHGQQTAAAHKPQDAAPPAHGAGDRPSNGGRAGASEPPPAHGQRQPVAPSSSPAVEAPAPREAEATVPPATGAPDQRGP